MFQHLLYTQRFYAYEVYIVIGSLWSIIIILTQIFEIPLQPMVSIRLQQFCLHSYF